MQSGKAQNMSNNNFPINDNLEWGRSNPPQECFAFTQTTCSIQNKKSISMKKLLSIIIVLALCTTNLNAQSKKDQPKPKSVNSNEKQTLPPDSVVVGFKLDLTVQEYLNIQEILRFLLTTSVPANQFVNFNEAINKAQRVVIANPEKTKK
jgi:hypothetical protein